MATHTIWGASQSSERIARGITWYTTARHGGIKLSAARQKEMPSVYKDNLGYGAADGWYEEDCNWAAVVVTWPQFFTKKQFGAAIETLGVRECLKGKFLPIGHLPCKDSK